MATTVRRRVDRLRRISAGPKETRAVTKAETKARYRSAFEPKRPPPNKKTATGERNASFDYRIGSGGRIGHRQCRAGVGLRRGSVHFMRLVVRRGSVHLL